MKILFTSHSFHPSLGGIETVSDILARYFVSAGHSVRLITQAIGDAETHKQLYPFSVVRKPSCSELVDCYRWADIIFQNNIEVRQLWPLLFLRRPCVISLHTWVRSIDGQRGWRHRLKLLALRRADRLIACSNAIRLDTESRAMVIGNPYNDGMFRRLSHVARRHAIVFLGRLVSDKGADMLVQAFAALQPTDWTLTMIGLGPELPRLQALVAELGVNNSVHFLGALQGESLAEVLNQHEILVVPSRWREPFGIVVLEGLACGCVVLTSDGGGLPDAVGPAGVLFRRGEQADLNAKLSQLVADVALRKELRSRADTHLQAFHHEVVCERYLALIQQTFNRFHKS